jgi:hypothetical protein
LIPPPIYGLYQATFCSSGSFSAQSAEVCSSCSPGTFAARRNSTTCSPCASGLDSDTGASRCSAVLLHCRRNATEVSTGSCAASDTRIGLCNSNIFVTWAQATDLLAYSPRFVQTAQLHILRRPQVYYPFGSSVVEHSVVVDLFARGSLVRDLPAAMLTTGAALRTQLNVTLTDGRVLSLKSAPRFEMVVDATPPRPPLSPIVNLSPGSATSAAVWVVNTTTSPMLTVGFFPFRDKESGVTSYKIDVLRNGSDVVVGSATVSASSLVPLQGRGSLGLYTYSLLNVTEAGQPLCGTYYWRVAATNGAGCTSPLVASAPFAAGNMGPRTTWASVTTLPNSTCVHVAVNASIHVSNFSQACAPIVEYQVSVSAHPQCSDVRQNGWWQRFPVNPNGTESGVDLTVALPAPLADGAYYFAVVAMDALGFPSDVLCGAPVLVDTTPPEFVGAGVIDNLCTTGRDEWLTVLQRPLWVSFFVQDLRFVASSPQVSTPLSWEVGDVILRWMSCLC